MKKRQRPGRQKAASGRRAKTGAGRRDSRRTTGSRLTTAGSIAGTALVALCFVCEDVSVRTIAFFTGTALLLFCLLRAVRLLAGMLLGAALLLAALRGAVEVRSRPEQALSFLWLVPVLLVCAFCLILSCGRQFFAAYGKKRRFSSVEQELWRIDHMNGYDFENWCAALLRQAGFRNVSVTPPSGDQGVDVLAERKGVRYAVQCKCYASNPGGAPVREVAAGRVYYHCKVGAVITNRYFTAKARDLADAAGVLLWDRDWITAVLERVCQ